MGHKTKKQTSTKKSAGNKEKDIKAYVIISDIHAGCQLGLCPPKVQMDEGGIYSPNAVQKAIWDMWNEFWNVHVPTMTNHHPFGIIINGDTIDGVHHGSTHQISHNLADQARIAKEILGPLVKLCEGRFYMIRGTEAHVGISGVEEERIARELGAIPNAYGQHARNELWKKIGNGLIHIAHAVGTTSSQAYESTAIHKELVEAYVESARWGERPPDMVIRSHRHRYFETMFATNRGRGRGVVTPGWQAKTPFIFRTAAKNQNPQFGGVVILENDSGEMYTRAQVWSVRRSRIE